MNVQQFRNDYSSGKKVSKREREQQLRDFWNNHLVTHNLETALNVCEDPQFNYPTIGLNYFSNRFLVDSFYLDVRKRQMTTRSELLSRSTRKLVNQGSIMDVLNKFFELRENVLKLLRKMDIDFSIDINGSSIIFNNILVLDMNLDYEEYGDRTSYIMKLRNRGNNYNYHTLDFLKQMGLKDDGTINVTVDIEKQSSVVGFLQLIKSYLKSYTFRDYVCRTLQLSSGLPSVDEIESDPLSYVNYATVNLDEYPINLLLKPIDILSRDDYMAILIADYARTLI